MEDARHVFTFAKTRSAAVCPTYRHIRIKFAATLTDEPAFLATLIGPSARSCQCRHKLSMTTAKLRNLLHRPAAPAKDNRRLQRAARRALLVGNGLTTTAEAARWGYARRQRLGSHHYKHMRRALSGIADRVGRAGGRARPWRWKLRDPGA
jgi:hypothetical protein